VRGPRQDPRTGAGRRAMIRLVCPHCGVQFLRLEARGEDEAVECPHCHRPFVPDEEEYVDPEDI